VPEISPAPLAPDHARVFRAEEQHRGQKQEVSAPKENMILDLYTLPSKPETDEVSSWEKNGCEGKLSETVKQDNPKKCVIGPIKRRLFGKEENYCQEEKDFNPDPAPYIQSVFFSLAAKTSESPQDEGDK